MGYTTIQYGYQELLVVSMTKTEVPNTIKSKVGRKLVITEIPGRDAKEYKISINGEIVGTTGVIDSKRTLLQALDDCTKHQFSDGIITASCIIEPGSLTFNDDANDFQLYKYNLTLVEYKQ